MEPNKPPETQNPQQSQLTETKPSSVKNRYANYSILSLIAIWAGSFLSSFVGLTLIITLIAFVATPILIYKGWKFQKENNGVGKTKIKLIAIIYFIMLILYLIVASVIFLMVGVQIF